MRHLKSVFFLPIIVLIVNCVKTPNCHHDLYFQNNSKDTVVWAVKIISGGNSSMCHLDGVILAPKGIYNFQLKPSDCWENMLSSGLEIFWVDPIKFNTTEFYYCDSLEFKNKILMQHYLTLQVAMQKNYLMT